MGPTGNMTGSPCRTVALVQEKGSVGGRLRGRGEVQGTISEKQRPAFGVRTGKASEYSPKTQHLFSTSSARHHPWGPLASTDPLRCPWVGFGSSWRTLWPELGLGHTREAVCSSAPGLVRKVQFKGALRGPQLRVPMRGLSRGWDAYPRPPATSAISLIWFRALEPPWGQACPVLPHLGSLEVREGPTG